MRGSSLGRNMAAHPNSQPIVFVLDDHPDVRAGIQALLETVHIKSRAFACVRDFWRSELPDVPSCLVCEVRMPNANGLDLQDELRRRGSKLPIIFITGYGGIPMAVRAMKAGATEFLTKPFREQDLLDAINSALEHDRQRREADAKLRAVKASVEPLTPRQRSVFHMWADGLATIEISHQLKLHRSTVRHFMHEVRTKLGTKTLRDLMRIRGAVQDWPRANEDDLAQSRIIPSEAPAVDDPSRRNAATAVVAASV